MVRIVGGRSWAVALAALHAAAFSDVPTGETWDAPAFTGLLDMPGCLAAVVEASGLALFRLAADECELLTIGVRPGARGRGVGGALLDAGMAECADRGARVMLLEVADGNAAALALYRRRGFDEVGRRDHYYGGGIDALVLSRALPPS